MSEWFQGLLNEIEREAKKLAEMNGTMKEKEKYLEEVSFPKIMKKIESEGKHNV